MPDGFTDPNTDPVDLDGGDATGTTIDAPGGSPWDSHLETYPEPIRDHVLAAMKHVEGHTTKQLQEFAELRKQYEPYADLKLHERDPTEVSGYLTLAQALDDPEQGPDMVRKLADYYGLTIADIEDELEDQPDEGDDLEPDEVPNELQALLDARLKPFEEEREAREQAERLAEAQAKAEATMSEIEAEIGQSLPDDVRDDLYEIGNGFLGKVDDPLRHAWGLLSRHTTRAQSQLVDNKLREPGQAEVGPSSPASGPQISKSMADAKAEVAALLRG